MSLHGPEANFIVSSGKPDDDVYTYTIGRYQDNEVEVMTAIFEFYKYHKDMVDNPRISPYAKENLLRKELSEYLFQGYAGNLPNRRVIVDFDDTFSVTLV